MKSAATTVESYLGELTPERRALVEPVLELMRESVPAGYEEAMNWGMICWQVPLSIYPDTYNKQPLMFAALGSQKNYVSLYLMSMYMNSAFGEMLDKKKLRKSGKSCINYTSLEELPQAEIRELVKGCEMDQFVERARSAHSERSVR